MANSIRNKKQSLWELFCYVVILSSTIGVFSLAVYMLGYIVYRGLPGLSLAFLTQAPNPITESVGIFPSIINTLYVIVLTLFLALPSGIGAAIYLSEYAKNQRLIQLIEFTIETLSGIPSIIYGVFGYLFFCLAWNLKVSLLSGALTLSIMVLPIIIRTTQEALRFVPHGYKEASLGLGADKWYMIRTILLPSSLPGIITATILSMGRIVSESAALLLVAGGSAMYGPKSFFQQITNSGSTLAVELYRYAYSRGNTEVGFSISLVLLIMVLLLIVVTRIIKHRLGKEEV